MRLPVVVLAALLLPALPGCLTCADVADAEPTLELGTGSTGFRALEEGDPVETGYGFQGGDHVWLSLRSTGLHPGYDEAPAPPSPFVGGRGGMEEVAGRDRPTVTATLGGDVGTVASVGDMPVLLEDGAAEAVTLFLQGPFSSVEMDPAWATETDRAQAEAAEAETLLLRAELTDVCGTTVSAERWVTIVIDWLHWDSAT